MPMMEHPSDIIARSEWELVQRVVAPLCDEGMCLRLISEVLKQIADLLVSA